jgi:hypothetical protein
MSHRINEISAPDDACYFLNLSGELRNHVYEYVLTASCPLRFRRAHPDDYGKFYRHQDNFTSHQDITDITNAFPDALLQANQLQYVNKQLRAEMLGLGLGHNELTFLDVEDLGYFLQRCAPFHLGRLRTLTFEYFASSQLAGAAGTLTIFQSCDMHPRALVKARLFIIKSPAPRSTLFYMSFEEYKLRGTHALWKSMFAEGSEWRRKFKGLCRFKSSLGTSWSEKSICSRHAALSNACLDRTRTPQIKLSPRI